MEKYYAFVCRYDKTHNFTFVYGEYGNGNSDKICVVRNEKEGRIAFHKEFWKHRRWSEGDLVDITQMVESGIISKDRLELLDLEVKRKKIED
ncbi:MAG: hypothetical protein WC867_04960 [Candidatus Pacearchaeota archaeon]|jgi:hypothetical protein